MNILVLNASPKGQNSTTVQTALYLQALHPEHTFTFLPVGQRIKAYEKDFAPVRAALTEMAREITARQPVYRVREGTLPGLKSGPVHFGFNRFARSTKPFYTTDACDGCGLCARDCPAGTIRLEGGRPVWGDHCYQCLRCLHACPRQAIQYGKDTGKKGRYHLAEYLPD